MTDIFHLSRFLAAQARDYDAALTEIRAGEKRSHWMWYIFPQLAGLGHSVMAQRYAIGSLDEAKAYLAHPVLGARLRECVAAINDLEAVTAEDVFGSTDATKLRSTLTLFSLAGGGEAFDAALSRWYAGPDPQTFSLLRASGQPL